MRAGFVARIRVNPKDCLSILDVVQGSGLNIEGMSFSAITSLATACMLEALRKANAIPHNDGFDFEQRMRPYMGGKSTYDRRVLTETLYVAAAKGVELPTLVASKPLDLETREVLLEEYKALDAIFRDHTPEQRVRYKELEQALSQP